MAWYLFWKSLDSFMVDIKFIGEKIKENIIIP